MKRLAAFGTILVASNLIVIFVRAQIPGSAITNYLQTTKIVGMKVKDSNGESVGTIKDVVFDRETGCMAYTVISTGDPGTRLTGTTKTVAVPWAVYNASSDQDVLSLTVNRERVYASPAFEYSRIGEYSTSSYINDVYSYYGVQPGGGRINAEPSPTASTQSSISPQITPTVSPTASVAPTPSSTTTLTPTPSPTPSPSVSPSATTKPKAPWAAAATKRATATPSPSASARRKSSDDSESEEGASERPRKRATPPEEGGPTP